MNHLFSFFLFVFLTQAWSFPVPSIWFGEFEIPHESKIYRQAQFFTVNNKTKFLFYELSFNNTRKWEELRIQGFFDSENSILRAEKCSLYGKQDIQKRWALLKSFDCEHLEWSVSFNKDTLTFHEKNGGFEDFTLDFVYTGKNSIFKIIDQNDNHILGWGLDAKRLYKAKFGKNLNSSRQIPILSVRESTIYFEPTKEKVDYIEVSSPKSESFFE